MSSFFKKPKATQVATPIYADTQGNVNQVKDLLTGGYTQGVADRDKIYTGASTLAKGLLDYGNKQLAEGGNLSPEQQSAIVRGAFQGAGNSGFTRFGSDAQTRGLTGRDLGLQTEDIANSRAKNAAGVLNMGEFQRPDFGSSLAQAFMQGTNQNLQAGNDWIASQTAANEAVKGKDSFAGGLLKGLITTGTYGGLNNLTSSL